MEDFKICSETGTKITRDMVISCISDTYKDIHGIRPRWMNFDGMTFEQLGDLLTELQKEAEEEYMRLDAWEVEQQKKKDKKIAELIEMGAGDKETAKRWLEQADVWD